MWKVNIERVRDAVFLRSTLVGEGKQQQSVIETAFKVRLEEQEKLVQSKIDQAYNELNNAQRKHKQTRALQMIKSALLRTAKQSTGSSFVTWVQYVRELSFQQRHVESETKLQILM